MSCELCSISPEKKIWENSYFYVIDAGNDQYPVFIRLIAQDHIKEMSDLPHPVFLHMCRLMKTIEMAVRQYTQCDKINWAQFGCFVPHLHWHCIARWENDINYPATPWNEPTRLLTKDQLHKYQNYKVALLRALPKLLTQVQVP